MSDKKQVIHVKDLVIQADHVYIERGNRQHDHSSNHHQQKRESGGPSEEQHYHESENQNHEKEQRGPGPFDWF